MNAALLQALADEGLGMDAAIRIVQKIEAAHAAELTVRETTRKVRNAERQKRFREKQNNAVTCDSVTPPNEYISNPPHSEANASAADPVKQVFDLGVSILTTSGSTEKQARSLIGKWCKGGREAEVLQALLTARGKASPLDWLNARFKAAKWVSKSGYEYRGSAEQVMREAERRGDNDTYWKAKGELNRERAA